VEARRIRGGRARGEALVCRSPLSFLGGIDTSTGKVLDPDCELEGRSVAGSVLCFPFGKGSTVGSYSMYQLRLNRLSPAGIVNESAETIVATGAIISGIPMVDKVDISLLMTGDDVRMDADEGVLEIMGIAERHVVTSILRKGRAILLLQRSSGVGSYRGQWAGVSGFIERGEDDEAAARREILEEVGTEDVLLRCRTEPQRFRDGDTVWVVHPFLFDLRAKEVRIDWEHQKYEWVLPQDIGGYFTVPGLQQVVLKLLEKASRSP